MIIPLQGMSTGDKDEDHPPKPPSLEREFAESTSLHGIGRVFHASKLIVKLIWIVIMITCLCVCIWQISDRIHRFLQYGAITDVSVEYVKDLDFPAVTVCNFNRYRHSALEGDDYQVLKYLWSLKENLFDLGSDYESVDYPSVWENRSANFNYTEFTLRTGFILDSNTLLNCKWRNVDQSCSSANFSQVFTPYGNCWTFNSGKTGPILKQSRPGSNNGLYLLIDIQQSEYTETINLEAGLRVLIHDQATPPMVASYGLAISPGVHAFMGVQKHQYLNLEPPYGKCDASKKLDRYDKYTLEGCNMECRVQRVVERCQCRIVGQPGDEVECSPRETFECANEVLDGLVTGTVEPCSCPVPCNYSNFITTLSTASIPNEKSISLLQALITIEEVASGHNVSFNESEEEDAVRHIKKNWVSLDVFYESINYRRYSQHEAITVSALTSDIGGQLGLFLGASFITLAEIFSYLGKKLEHWFCKPGQRRSAAHIA